MKQNEKMIALEKLEAIKKTLGDTFDQEDIAKEINGVVSKINRLNLCDHENVTKRPIIQNEPDGKQIVECADCDGFVGYEGRTAWDIAHSTYKITK